MIRFADDYSEGAHPRIFAALKDYNAVQFETYGEDGVCATAANIIRERIGRDDVDVHFIDGGTHANLTVIAAALRPHQAVVSAASGHISVHETGAIEATGHKVITVAGEDGRVTTESLLKVCKDHYFDQMVKPGLLYLSQATELGSIYTKAQLQALYETAHDHGMVVFIDGARLGVALACGEGDLTFEDLPQLCDAFTIGGTKNGAMFGEAVVLVDDGLKQDFRFHMRQRGALLAKGWILGMQFWSLLKDSLYLRLAEAAVNDAQHLRKALEDCGYEMYSHSPTNLIFPILPRGLVEQLRQQYEFHDWVDEGGDTLVVRFVTSWATQEEHLNALIAEIQNYKACS